MSLRAPVRSGLIWIGGTRFASQVLTWAITIVVIRLLTPADYGLLAMATVFMSCLSMVAEAGLGQALVQAPAMDDLQLKRIFGAIILVDFTLFAVQFAAAPLIATFFGEDRLTAIVRVLALQFLITIFVVIPSALLSRRLEFKKQSLISLGSSVLSSLVSLGMAFSGYGVWALVAGTLLASFVNAVAINAIAPFLRRPDFSLKGMRGLLVFGGQVTAGRALWLLYSQADLFIAGKLLGKEMLGYYSISMHLASLPVQKLSSIINPVAYPAFASARDDPSHSAWYLLKAIRILCFIGFPVLWGISSVAPELVNVLLGPQWGPAILPLQVLTLIMPFRVVNNFLPNATDARGRADIGVRNLIVANVVMLPAFFIGSLWGLTGLTAAWGLVWPVVFLMNLFRSLPVVNLRVRDVLRAMAVPALCGLGMYAAVFVAKQFVFPGDDGVPRLVIPIVVGVVAYGILALAVNLKVCREIFELVKP